MIIGKNSFIKGAILFLIVVLAILNIVAVCFAPHWLLITSGIVLSAGVITACVVVYRYFEKLSE